MLLCLDSLELQMSTGRQRSQWPCSLVASVISEADRTEQMKSGPVGRPSAGTLCVSVLTVRLMPQSSPLLVRGHIFFHFSFVLFFSLSFLVYRFGSDHRISHWERASDSMLTKYDSTRILNALFRTFISFCSPVRFRRTQRLSPHWDWLFCHSQRYE